MGCKSPFKYQSMTTTLEFLNQVYKDVQTDYIDSNDREEALELIAELTIKLAELR